MCETTDDAIFVFKTCLLSLFLFHRPATVTIWNIPSADHDYLMKPAPDNPMVDLTISPMNSTGGLEVVMFDSVEEVREELVMDNSGERNITTRIDFIVSNYNEIYSRDHDDEAYLKLIFIENDFCYTVFMLYIMVTRYMVYMGLVHYRKYRHPILRGADLSLIV